MLYGGLKAFINARIGEHPQIAEWLSGWSPAHETQVNIDTTGLEPDELGESFYLDEDGRKVSPIRIPHRAMGEPYHHDRPLYGEQRYWHAIGTTGWNWRTLRSEWVGYDFDSIQGHARGLSPEHLEEIRQRALSLKYVVARTSTGGKGIHLLVPVSATTRNHTQHALLAQDILNRMSRDCDFQFNTKIDCCGLVLWHWKTGLGNDCLRRIT